MKHIYYHKIKVKTFSSATTGEIFWNKAYHKYVKPTVIPKLTDFCTELTGITQATVENGVSIYEALSGLKWWMIENGFDIKNSVFMTCGDWDLKVCLPAEAAFKTFQIEPTLKRWVNVKTYFQSVTGKKPKGMSEMLKECGMEIQGRHHSGIDDAKNIARIVSWLQYNNGHVTSCLVNKNSN